MQNQHNAAPMCAAIDIGSNTIHIVVARCMSDNLELVADEVELVRIGESVTATGAISPQKRDDTLATLQKYKAIAEHHQASPIFVVATEAIRQATNSAEFLQDVQRETGLQVHVIEGTIEAELTFMGATYERVREPDAPRELAVMDLGGGSMELVMAEREHITWRTSVPIGSGWLHDRYFVSDPPKHDELDVAHTFLNAYFEGMHLTQYPPALIATGGSANSLMHLAHHAFGLDLHVMYLTHEALVHCEGLLSALPAEEIAQRYQQPLERARILPAGALIIRTLMEHLQLDEVSVSPHGIREGVLLAYARYGDDWLQRVQQQVVSASGSQDVSKAHDKKNDAWSEAFVRSGRRLLMQRTDKMCSLLPAVLKKGDSESIHKMRVASRRLRATFDAYEPICDPRSFKKVYKRIKKIADVLGRVRDADVMIEHLQTQRKQVSQEEQVGLEWLIERLSSYRKQQHKQMESFLKGLHIRELEKQIEACIEGEGGYHGKS